MKVRTLLATALATGLTAVALMPAPAQGAVVEVQDAVGDTSPPNDVTQIRVNNGDLRLRVAVHYRNLGEGHISASMKIDTRQRGGEYYLFSRSQNFDGVWRNRLLRVRPHQGISTVRCPGRDVDYQPGEPSRISFLLPQRCLGNDAGGAWFRYHGSQHEGSGPPRPEHAPAAAFFVGQG